MKERTVIGKAIASVFLLSALLFPSAIQFTHAFEGHEDISCKQKSTHIHQKVSECHICDFHFFSFNYDIIKYQEFAKISIPSKMVTSFTTQFSNLLNNNNTSLRGPPCILA
ncbi:hypothetical protein H0I23_12965 [Cellulophaga sp. HaHaR_3_176]|uniref:hypothetical protein n=1 Tax=Cellulophaga sp. HaHaR_3_176 TaxID=1942464 RepID=UPI001C1F71C1|nr:hypothetical protein [Cellulophaga sp. HaHaR_3_176]QWX83357.1 hypothetical protein H0I23_12965 [Cellulophaga sp. HaHaR_3_176]